MCISPWKVAEAGKDAALRTSSLWTAGGLKLTQPDLPDSGRKKPRPVFPAFTAGPLLQHDLDFYARISNSHSPKTPDIYICSSEYWT